jgi:apolipoprotein N-acyltransferase
MYKPVYFLLGFLLSAICFYYSRDYGWLAWFAPLPILVIGPRLSARLLFIGAALSYWAGSMSWWSAESFVVSLPFFLGYHLLYAIVFALIMVWVRKTTIIWLFPIGWTAFEFLVAQLSPEGTWGSLAYSQTAYLSLMQNVSISGIYGIVFLVCLFSSSIAYFLNQRDWNRAMMARASILILCILIASGWGTFRIKTLHNEDVVRVGLTAANDTVPFEESQDSAKNILFIKEYVGHVALLANQGAQIVVLPEKLVRVTTTDQQEMEAIFSKSAADNEVYLEVSVKLELEDGVHNKAWIYSPDGKKIIDYDKIHMVPGLEDGFIAGHEMAWFNGFNQKIGTVICKDMDFPATIREYGRENIGLLLVPAWDWKGSEQIHSRMAVVRGIENGFAIVRPSKEGLVNVSDRYGRVLKEQSAFAYKDATVVADVPISPRMTLYSKWGDWFGWLILGGAIIAAIFTFLKRKKPKSTI